MKQKRRHGRLDARLDAALVQDLVDWRRHLHSHPELSHEEFETTKFIADLLTSFGLQPERPLKTGVVARIGAGRGPVLALRADIDALPILQDSTLKFASRYPGRTHACGHDGHTAILLAVAKVLSQCVDELPGEVRLLFQPAEEVIDGGAARLVEAGCLDGVAAALGVHLWSSLETGLISVTPGTVLASTDEFRVVVRGRGGHAGYPHQCVDALLVAAHVVCDVQTIVSRKVDPLRPAVVTIGTFNSGSAYNVIAQESRLSGTVRTHDEHTRLHIELELRDLVTQAAAAFGAEAEFLYRRGNPPLVNDEKMAAQAVEAASGVVGSEAVRADPPSMGGDDFAWYAQRVPSAFVFIGARNAEIGAVFPHHHPRFAIDEDSLAIGARFFLSAVERFFRDAEPK